MIKINKILLLLLAGTLFSCNNWLELDPANQISKEKLYSDEIGFQNALNGIYQMCSEPALYGKNLSWGTLSAIAQNYTDANDYSDYYMMQYDYERTQTLATIDGIWKGLYNAIANCNLLLNEVTKASPEMFKLDTITKNIIEGEALALRAICHLDLVRLFSPAPVKNEGAKLIPYQDKYPSELTNPLTTSETLDRVITDLLKAKDLLAYNDTVYHKTQMRYKMAARFQGQYSAAGGDFFNKRGYRMNYCAVVGLLTRAYLYKGDQENALKYAKHIYDRFIKGNAFFSFHSSNDYSTSLANKQKKYLDECIFAFYNKNMLNIVENYYKTYSENLPVEDVENIFLNDEDDYRIYLIQKDGSSFGNSLKYRQVDNYQRDDVEGRAIPVLRISEIYYTLIECYYEKGETAEALKLLKELRSAKGCKRQIVSINSQPELHEILINDARREFIGEGQLFYMYKRLNHGILTRNGEFAPTEERVTFIIPDSQNIN